MGVRFDKQLWFNLKESKREYLSIYFRMMIGLLCIFPSSPSMTLLQFSMKFKGSPHSWAPHFSAPLCTGAGCLHCSGGWYAGQITVPSIPSPAPWVPPAPCCSIGRLQAQPLVLQPSQPSPAQSSPASPAQPSPAQPRPAPVAPVYAVEQRHRPAQAHHRPATTHQLEQSSPHSHTLA